jgi:hypothetical protein
MAVRSASAMVIPMMEFQAQQFRDGGMFHGKIQENMSLYTEIERRLAELRESQQAREEEPANAYLAAQKQKTTEQQALQQKQKLQQLTRQNSGTGRAQDSRRKSDVDYDSDDEYPHNGMENDDLHASFGGKQSVRRPTSSTEDDGDLYAGYRASYREQEPHPRDSMEARDLFASKKQSKPNPMQDLYS